MASCFFTCVTSARRRSTRCGTEFERTGAQLKPRARQMCWPGASVRLWRLMTNWSVTDDAGPSTRSRAALTPHRVALQCRLLIRRFSYQSHFSHPHLHLSLLYRLLLLLLLWHSYTDTVYRLSNIDISVSFNIIVIGQINNAYSEPVTFFAVGYNLKSI